MNSKPIAHGRVRKWSPEADHLVDAMVLRVHSIYGLDPRWHSLLTRQVIKTCKTLKDKERPLGSRRSSSVGKSSWVINNALKNDDWLRAADPAAGYPPHPLQRLSPEPPRQRTGSNTDASILNTAGRGGILARVKEEHDQEAYMPTLRQNCNSLQNMGRHNEILRPCHIVSTAPRYHPYLAPERPPLDASDSASDRSSSDSGSEAAYHSEKTSVHPKSQTETTIPTTSESSSFSTAPTSSYPPKPTANPISELPQSRRPSFGISRARQQSRKPSVAPESSNASSRQFSNSGHSTSSSSWVTSQQSSNQDMSPSPPSSLVHINGHGYSLDPYLANISLYVPKPFYPVPGLAYIPQSLLKDLIQFTNYCNELHKCAPHNYRDWHKYSARYGRFCVACHIRRNDNRHGTCFREDCNLSSGEIGSCATLGGPMACQYCANRRIPCIKAESVPCASEHGRTLRFWVVPLPSARRVGKLPSDSTFWVLPPLPSLPSLA